MRFRITAVQDAGTPASTNVARLRLEDLLNSALADVDFGCDHCTLMIVIFCTTFEMGSPPVSRLVANGDGTQTLTLHVVIDPEEAFQTVAEGQLKLLASHVAAGLPQKPLRTPRGLDYFGLRQALLATIQPMAQSTI